MQNIGSNLEKDAIHPTVETRWLSGEGNRKALNVSQQWGWKLLKKLENKGIVYLIGNEEIKSTNIYEVGYIKNGEYTYYFEELEHEIIHSIVNHVNHDYININNPSLKYHVNTIIPHIFDLPHMIYLVLIALADKNGKVKITQKQIAVLLNRDQNRISRGLKQLKNFVRKEGKFYIVKGKDEKCEK